MQSIMSKNLFGHEANPVVAILGSQGAQKVMPDSLDFSQLSISIARDR
jgi:hypothetical protein